MGSRQGVIGSCIRRLNLDLQQARAQRQHKVGPLSMRLRMSEVGVDSVIGCAHGRYENYNDDVLLTTVRLFSG